MASVSTCARVSRTGFSLDISRTKGAYSHARPEEPPPGHLVEHDAPPARTLPSARRAARAPASPAPTPAARARRTSPACRSRRPAPRGALAGASAQRTPLRAPSRARTSAGSSLRGGRGRVIARRDDVERVPRQVGGPVRPARRPAASSGRCVDRRGGPTRGASVAPAAAARCRTARFFVRRRLHGTRVACRRPR